VVVTGDVAAPDFFAAFVNLRANASGRVVDVLFDEDVDETFVEDETNWSTSPTGLSVQSAACLGGNVVRLTFATPFPSGEDVELASGLPDLAGNATIGPISIQPVQ
jgi:hypothetical protein